MTDEAGLATERSTYRPFGEEAEQLLSLSTPKETKGFIPFSRFATGKTLPRQRANASTTHPACNTSTQDTT
ncbi:MAG: hypothetical protein WBH14_07665, partial [Albidovulum sp.]